MKKIENKNVLTTINGGSKGKIVKEAGKFVRDYIIGKGIDHAGEIYRAAKKAYRA